MLDQSSLSSCLAWQSAKHFKYLIFILQMRKQVQKVKLHFKGYLVNSNPCVHNPFSFLSLLLSWNCLPLPLLLMVLHSLAQSRRNLHLWRPEKKLDHCCSVNWKPHGQLWGMIPRGQSWSPMLCFNPLQTEQLWALLRCRVNELCHS